MPRRLDAREAGFERAFAALLAERREAEEAADAAVAPILDAVRTRGDAALIELTARFDRLDMAAADLEIGSDEIDRAVAACGEDELAALRTAAARIQAFHERQRPDDLAWTDADGIRLGLRWTAMRAVGIYVPGGTAAYPSSVLMNAIPARVAGVDRVVMTVPTPDGRIAPLVLAAARIAGVDRIYRVGGAQAVAALAWGTESVEPVDKIVGPGNAYVAAAKRRVFGQVGIDMIAGPSEVLVVADADNDPAWIAADLLAQAEHDAAAQSILITDSVELADGVAEAVESLLATLPRRETAGASWRDHGAIVIVPDLDDAPALVDRIAPEHLELAVTEPDRLAARIRNAGAIFLGRWTPEAIGDYVGGPNHVLPTAGSARFSSGLGVLDFMKRTTLLGCDADGLARLGPPALTLARVEGLDAHGLSIRIRQNPRPGE